MDDDGIVHEGYIEAIARESITSGCTDVRYCPSDHVTRGQMAAFIRRALQLPASRTDHFRDDRGHLFEDDINAIAQVGITQGCRDGSVFCPDDTVSRGEMAAFLRRAGKMPVSNADLFTDDDRSVFEGDIDAIARAGITAGCNPPSNTRFCPSGRTTRAQMASFLGRLLDLTPTPPPARDPSDMPVRDAIRTWFPENYSQALRVADCESSLNPRAYNPNGGYYGIFQISKRYHQAAFERVTGRSWGSSIYSAYYNAQYARDLYDRQGWSPWSCRP